MRWLVAGSVFVHHFVCLQQSAGVYIQVLGQPIGWHIRLCKLCQFCGASLPFPVLGVHNSRHHFQYRVRGLFPQLPLYMVQVPHQEGNAYYESASQNIDPGIKQVCNDGGFPGIGPIQQFIVGHRVQIPGAISYLSSAKCDVSQVGIFTGKQS